jgi:hypothetical protein
VVDVDDGRDVGVVDVCDVCGCRAGDGRFGALCGN